MSCREISQVHFVAESFIMNFMQQICCSVWNADLFCQNYLMFMFPLFNAKLIYSYLLKIGVLVSLEAVSFSSFQVLF